jgi:hypothetical protein
MSEMDIRPEDLDDDLDRVESADFDIEASEADAVEQRLPVQSVGDHRDRVPLEVDPADAAEQNRVVELDDDDYR